MFLSVCYWILLIKRDGKLHNRIKSQERHCFPILSKAIKQKQNLRKRLEALSQETCVVSHTLITEHFQDRVNSSKFFFHSLIGLNELFSWILLFINVRFFAWFMTINFDLCRMIIYKLLFAYESVYHHPRKLSIKM